MHIVIVGHTRFPISQPFAGGLESVTWHLAQGLVGRGHRVSIFAARGTEPLEGVEHLWPDELPLSPAAREDASMPDEGGMRRHHAYLQLMLSLARRRDVDVVHSHALHHLPAALAPTLPVPMVLSLHTPPTPWLESALRIAQQAGRPPAVTAVSDHTARAWSHLVPARVVRNGVDTAQWTPGPGGDGLVWSGRIVPEKAPHLAIRVARAAGLPLVLAGPVGDERYYREVVAPMLGDGVEHAGHLRLPELADLVGRSAAALVTPVWDEPYGLVAAEALACGTPVLALRRGGLPEVVGPAVGALVPVDGADDEAVVARAAALLPTVLGRSREACRSWAVQRLSIGSMIDAYERVYADLLGHPLPPALGVAG